MSQKNVKLLEASRNVKIDADILTITSKHIADVTTYWKHRLKPSEEEDRHWDWGSKIRLKGTSNFESYALECQQITQGLIILEIDFHRSRIESGKSLVYVDYLSTAPWNRSSFENPARYKGVGGILLGWAVSRSFDLEYQGRIGLHSLPKAEGFYRKFNINDFGKDPNYYNLRYFELSSESAKSLFANY
jgi:hypothetical protein